MQPLEVASTLLNAMAALFIMMGLGFLLVRLKLLKSSDSRALSLVLIYLIGPAVVLRAFSIDFTPEVRDGFLLALGAALVIHVLLFGIAWLYGKAIRLTPVEKASVMYSNAGNLIIPLVSVVLDDSYVIYSSAFICVQLFFIWTHGQIMISGEKQIPWKKILLNPNLLACVVGMGMLLLHIKLPPLLSNVCGQLSGTMGPVCMIMIGMLLAEVPWKQILTSGRTWLVMALKMVGTPLLILLFLKLTHAADLVPDGGKILYISFMAVMTPAATTVTQLAQMYRQEAEYSSAINVLTTLICILTMPVMTWLYWLL